MGLKVDQNSRGLEDDKIAAVRINEHRDTAIGVQLDEPWFLLNIRRDVDVLGPARSHIMRALDVLNQDGAYS